MAANRHVVPIGDVNQLEVVTRERGTTMTIELAGEWDLAGAATVRRVAVSALTSRPECLVLDLSRLEFIDSSGVHATIELAQRADAENVRLVIIPAPHAVQRVFEITGVANQLPFIDKPPTDSRTARPRSALDRAAGSGGISLRPHGAGRRSKAAGA